MARPLDVGRAALVAPQLPLERQEEAVVDVGRLEVPRVGLGQVAGQRAQRRGRRQRLRLAAGPLERQVERHREPGRRRLEVALDAGDLAGEAHARRAPQAVERVEMGRRVDEGVAVHLAEAHEDRALEARDDAEDALLLGPLHARLEADQVELGAGEVLLAQLHDGVGPPAVRRAQPDRLHRPEAQRVDAAPRHLLDRQAALEEERLLEVAQRRHLGLDDRLVKGQVLLAVHAAR